MQSTDNFEIEQLSGSFYQIGFDHGLANAARMSRLLFDYGVDLDAGSDEKELLEPLERYLPHLAEELTGIAEGSGLGLRATCALSFLVDMSLAPASRPSEKIGSACTGVIFESGPDGPVIGKTSDCAPGVQQRWLNVRLVRPDAAYHACIYSHIGSPNAEMGMNEKGLAIGISGLLSRQFDPAGVGWQQDIRGVLHACSTTEEAISMLREIPIRRAGYSAVVGDASGHVAIVEKLVGAVEVRYPKGNVAFEANVALCENALPFVDEAWCSANGTSRMQLLEKLLGNWNNFSCEGMIDLFATHAKPVGLCQHGPELHSNMGFFMLPSKGELWIAPGYTCERNLTRLRF